MASLRCPLGYPAHGEKIVDLPSKMKEYIQHKEFRIRQVFSTLERSQMSGERQGRGRGGMTILELVEAMYGSVPENVEKALVPFLSQALWKLAEDRKVGFEAGEPTKRRWFVSPKKG
jgi:hydrolase